MKVLFAVAITCFLVNAKIHSQNSFFISLGSNYGGAPANQSIQNASGVPKFGGAFEIGYQIPFRKSFLITPSISFDHRHFKYRAAERNDTVVLVEVMESLVSIPTYYVANITGRINSGGLSLNLAAQQRIINKAWLTAGFYFTYFLYKNDMVNVKVRIGEGGLLPDVYEDYNNKFKMKSQEFGILLGGNYKLSNRFSFGIIGFRAFNNLYYETEIKNDKNESLKLYSTYAKILLFYCFPHRPTH